MELTEAFGTIRGAFLRLYYFVLFNYHMMMYKRAVRNEGKSVSSKKDGGGKGGS
jgi:hypothetical protein